MYFTPKPLNKQILKNKVVLWHNHNTIITPKKCINNPLISTGILESVFPDQFEVDSNSTRKGEMLDSFRLQADSHLQMLANRFVWFKQLY